MLYFCSCATQTMFLGGYMVDADGPKEAVARAVRLGFHPGGEVLVLPIGDILSDEELAITRASWTDRLLTKAQLEQHTRAIGKNPSEEDRSYGSLSEEERNAIWKVATKVAEVLN